jgi:hypothetical protein
MAVPVAEIGPALAAATAAPMVQKPAPVSLMETCPAGAGHGAWAANATKGRMPVPAESVNITVSRTTVNLP